MDKKVYTANAVKGTQFPVLSTVRSDIRASRRTLSNSS
jgi:hypothetical protein